MQSEIQDLRSIFKIYFERGGTEIQANTGEVLTYNHKKTFSYDFAQIKETLEEYNVKITRDGDDLFFDNRKLSVSIATKTITSCLIHSGLNIIKEGAPIEVSDLTEVGITDIKEFANKVMQKYSAEISSIKTACYKVRGVVE